jgi:hypothetical protein
MTSGLVSQCVQRAPIRPGQVLERSCQAAKIDLMFWKPCNPSPPARRSPVAGDWISSLLVDEGVNPFPADVDGVDVNAHRNALLLLTFRVSRRKEGRDVQDPDTEVVVMS